MLYTHSQTLVHPFSRTATSICPFYKILCLSTLHHEVDGLALVSLHLLFIYNYDYITLAVEATNTM